MPARLKEKFYRIKIRPAMTYETECWLIMWQHMYELDVVEMRMLRSMCGKTMKDI